MYLKAIIKMQMENSIDLMRNTPGNGYNMGREVNRKNGKFNFIKIRTKSDGELEFMASDNKWYPLDQADMAHLTDSVSWWNSTYR